MEVLLKSQLHPSPDVDKPLATHGSVEVIGKLAGKSCWLPHPLGSKVHDRNQLDAKACA